MIKDHNMSTLNLVTTIKEELPILLAGNQDALNAFNTYLNDLKITEFVYFALEDDKPVICYRKKDNMTCQDVFDNGAWFNKTIVSPFKK